MSEHEIPKSLFIASRDKLPMVTVLSALSISSGLMDASGVKYKHADQTCRPNMQTLFKDIEKKPSS